MSHFIHQFLFGIYPYLALTIFFVGSLLRYRRDQYTWKADSSLLLRSKGMRMGSNLFHIGIILLFFGHLVGLLTPKSVYHLFMSSDTKQLMAMVAGSCFGIVCLIGLTMLLKRRLFDPRIRTTSNPSDIVVLLILYVELILGFLIIPYSTQHPDARSMIALASWAQHIVTFRAGAADFMIGQSWVPKVHLFLGLTIFLIFPFTRLVHVFSAPIHYLFRKGYQIVRSRG